MAALTPGPTPETPTPQTLPDLLRPGLDLVFVGINPGEQSARAGHYYAHPGNAFWRLLSASGLTPRDVGPDDDRWLSELCGIGFTDVVKRVVTDSTQVTRAEFRESLPAFRSRIAGASPRVVCFTAGRAFDEAFPKVRTSRLASAWGRQPVTLDGAEGSAGCEVWVMPSTSGLAAKWRAQGREVLAGLAARLHARAVDAQHVRGSNLEARQVRGAHSGAQQLRDRNTARA